MLKSAVHWGLFFVALLAAGPLAWLMTGPLRGEDGSSATIPILSNTPLSGLIRAAFAVAIAGVVGLVSARVVSLKYGFFNAGMVLAWAAEGTSTIDSLIRNDSPAKLNLLSVEAGVLGLIAVAFAVGITRLAIDERPLAGARPPETVKIADLGIIFAITLAAAGLATWLIAQNTLKGQMLAAAAGAAILAAAASAFAVRKVDPASIIAGLAAAAVIAFPATILFHGSGGLGKAILADQLLHVGRLVPLDWLAGGFLGLPLGLSLGSWLNEFRQKPTGRLIATV